MTLTKRIIFSVYIRLLVDIYVDQSEHRLALSVMICKEVPDQVVGVHTCALV